MAHEKAKLTEMKKENLVKSEVSTIKSQSQLCYACNSSGVRVSYDDSIWRVLRCLDCGLYFVNPMPTFKESESHPSDVLYEAGEKISQLEKQKVRAKCTANEIIKLYHGRKLFGNRILDIGCGYGLFLKLLDEYGCEVYGCEQNIAAREYAEKMGLNVYQDLNNKDLWREDFYDVITLWNVLEHLNDPLKLLSDCQHLLRKGGAIVVRVPNIFSDLVIWQIGKLCGKNPSYMQVPMHLFGFSVSSLKLLLKRAGFVGTRLIPAPLGDHAYYMEKRFGHRKAQMIVKFAEYLNLAILKLSFFRSAGFLSTTMVAYRPH